MKVAREGGRLRLEAPSNGCVGTRGLLLRDRAREQTADPPAPLPLRRLEFRDALFGRPERVVHVFEMDQLRELFTLLGQTSIERFDFSMGVLEAEQLPHLLAPLPRAPSVTLLKIQGDDYDNNIVMDTTDDLLTLRHILMAFPSLTHLVLQDFDFSPSVDLHNRAHHAPDSMEFLFLHPTLLAFLTFLRQSTVLSFTWDKTYWWSRRSVDDDFHVDRYYR